MKYNLQGNEIYDIENDEIIAKENGDEIRNYKTGEIFILPEFTLEEYMESLEENIPINEYMHPKIDYEERNKRFEDLFN